MTKNEKYDALKPILKVKGVTLKHINNLSSDEVDVLYTKHIEISGGIATPPDLTGDNTNTGEAQVSPEAIALVEEAKKEAADIIESAKAESDQLIESAKAESDQLIESAKAESDQLIESAKAESDQLIESAKAESDQLIESAKKIGFDIVREAEEKAAGITGEEPELEEEELSDVEIKPLVFKTSGWCEELKMSFKKGNYKPKNAKEYITLKKYAAQE